jgi:hypothetical protein
VHEAAQLISSGTAAHRHRRCTYPKQPNTPTSLWPEVTLRAIAVPSCRDIVIKSASVSTVGRPMPAGPGAMVIGQRTVGSYVPSRSPLSSVSISEFRSFAALMVAPHQASLPLADISSMFALMAEKKHLRCVSGLIKRLQL